MKTHCNQKTFDFQTQNSCKIVAHFNGGNITSDAGAALPAVPHTKKRLKIRICTITRQILVFHARFSKTPFITLFSLRLYIFLPPP
jgi:hypothetical protein